MSFNIPKRALVLGLAASGEAAVRLLLHQGADVFAVDQADTENLRQTACALEAAGARVLLGCSTLPAEAWSLAVLSPGLGFDSALLRSVRNMGVPMISELELGWQCARSRAMAITGSNGKSTLAALCKRAFQNSGLKAEATGNFGPPVSRVALEQPDLDWLVIEASSFQLEAVREFRPDIGVLLNIFPNHLDRHGSFETYSEIKRRLFAKMRASDVAIAPHDMLADFKARASGANCWLGFGNAAKADYYYAQGRIVAQSHGKKPQRVLDLAGTYFDNDVLGLGAAAAMAAADCAGLPPDALDRAVHEFKPLPHRLQEVASCRGVRFVDDSKATNLAAMMAALRMTPPPIRLIAGGLPKNEPFEPALPLLQERVAKGYLIGKAAPDMAAVWRRTIHCGQYSCLESAVRAAWSEALKGETILLAPACASFDQFRSFEERGKQFSELAVRLTSSARNNF